QNKTYPSWGYSIEQGATTIWERWNSYTKEKGFGNADMNSFNHYAYGACGEWMFRSMLGIETDGAGFKKITMKPELGEGVTWAKGHYDSIHGRTSSGWKRDPKTFQWEVVVPPNTTATIHVPAKTATDVTESGQAIAKADGVKFLRMENDRAVFSLDSGSYEFVSQYYEGTDVSGAESIRPADLRCEYLVDPLGIDEPKPRLSWQGEHEAGLSRKMAEDYDKLLADFMRAVRRDLKTPSLPFVIGQVNSHTWAFGDIARDRQA
ncbi:unnamed protein product, partial [marine sediment metagenome]